MAKANPPPRRVIKRRRAETKSKPSIPDLGAKANPKSIIKNPSIPKATPIVVDPASERYKQVAEYHMPNRVWSASTLKIPADQFWSFVPVKCYWCKAELALNKLVFCGTGGLKCKNEKLCLKTYKANAPKPKSQRPKRVLRRPKAHS